MKLNPKLSLKSNYKKGVKVTWEDVASRIRLKYMQKRILKALNKRDSVVDQKQRIVSESGIINVGLALKELTSNRFTWLMDVGEVSTNTFEHALVDKPGQKPVEWSFSPEKFVKALNKKAPPTSLKKAR